jgi:hypothetical protein
MIVTQSLLLTALITAPLTGFSQTLPLPLVVESAVIVPIESGSDDPPLMDITVRNAGTSTIIAWGVWTEVRFADGTTRASGSTVDAYEGATRHIFNSPELAPNARYTLRVLVPAPKTPSAPVDVASMPTFAVFKDNTAVGDDKTISMIFRMRATHQRFWELVENALKSRRQGSTPTATLQALLSELETVTDKEVLASVMYVRVKDQLTRSLLGRSPEPLAAVVGRLAQEASGGRQVAALHSQRLR